MKPLRPLIAVVFVLLLSAPAFAAEWADKMFSKRQHDFGNVARGAKTEHAFTITNLYKEDIHFAGVRTTCGCTTPRLTKSTLKSREQGQLICRFNTDSFKGANKATIIVTIDRPYYAEVRVNVHGYVRRDVVFEPGEVEFGQVDYGQGAQREITVNYAGRVDWQIVDVRSANKHYEVELNETSRSLGRVSYQLIVGLAKDAPPGYLTESLYLVTNDTNVKRIPLEVSGRVLPTVTVSPAALSLGTVKPGETVTKRLVVRAKQPFRITGIDCPDDCFKFSPPSESKKLHFVPITFTAEKSGRIVRRIKINTDIAGGSAELVASATVEAGS